MWQKFIFSFSTLTPLKTDIVIVKNTNVYTHVINNDYKELNPSNSSFFIGDPKDDNFKFLSFSLKDFRILGTVIKIFKILYV